MDYFDLNDWILEFYPEVHKSTRYLSSTSVQMECWQKVYDQHKDY